MTDDLLLVLAALPPAVAAAVFWRRARRAEARLAADDSRHRALTVEMVRLAEHDPLTGLGNRRAFDRAMNELQAAGEPGAVIVLDLDNFKQVNDRLGHQRGDEVLRAVARSLWRGVRESDVVARLGGDEFGIVLQRADTERAERVAADLRAGVIEACASLPLRKPVDASVGVAPLGEAPGDATELLARADAAMYRTKLARRSRSRPRRRFRASHQLELGASGHAASVQEHPSAPRRGLRSLG
jgi:diguanylate cyclase (GGDEF)-like protein